MIFAMIKIIVVIWSLLFVPLEYTFNIFLTTYQLLKSFLVEGRHGKKLLIKTTFFQIYFTGIQALPIIITAGLILGTATIVELSTLLPKFGAGKYVNQLAVIVMVRELIPILTALIIIGRSGTAMATELGNMKLNREIELLDSLGINIDYFLVLPRLIGNMTAIICLTVIFNAVAICGGFLFAKIFTNVAGGIIFTELVSAISYQDMIISLAKAFIFGWVISIVNCTQGLSVKKSFTEVPQVTTSGVVSSIIFCFICSIFISLYIFPSFNI